MLRAHKSLPALFLVAILGGACWAQGAELAGLLDKLGSKDANVREQAIKDTAAVGVPALAPLFALIDEGYSTAGTCATRAAKAIVHKVAGGGRASAAADVLADVVEGCKLPGTRDQAAGLLSLVAGAQQVDRVAGWAKSPELLDSACYILGRIPGSAPAVAVALENALAQRDTKATVALAGVLGELRDPAGLLVLANCMGAGQGAEIAALKAIAAIGEPESEKLIRAELTSTDAEVSSAAWNAYVTLAYAVLGSGPEGRALPMLDRLLRDGPTSELRCAGLRGYASASGDEAALPVLIKAIRSDDPVLSGVAAEGLAAMPPDLVLPQLRRALVVAAIANKATILGVLGRIGGPEASAAAQEAAGHGAASVRIAAYGALAAIRDPGAVPRLLSAVQSEKDAAKAAALRAVQRTGGPDSVSAILASLRRGDFRDDPATRAALVTSLGERSNTSVTSFLLREAASTDDGCATAALGALGTLNDPASVAPIRDLLGSLSKTRVDAAVAALEAMPKDTVKPVLLAGLPSAGPKVAAPTLRVLGEYKDATLRGTFAHYAATEDADVAAAAITALAGVAKADTEAVLRRYLKDPRDPVRAAVIGGLLGLAEARKPQDDAALAVYTEAVTTPGVAEDAVRRALRGIARIANPASLDALAALIASPGNVGNELGDALLAIAAKIKDTDKGRATSLYQKVLAISRSRESIRAAAQALRDLGLQVDLAAPGGFVTGWWVVGPLDARDTMRKQNIIDPSQPIDVNAPVSHGGREFAWKFHPVDDALGMFDLEVACARQDNVGCYVCAEVESDADRDVTLKIGSDDDVVVWVNGTEVHRFIGDRGWGVDQDAAKAHLVKGWNRILCMVLNGGAQWSVSVRFVDDAGNPIVLAQRKP